MQSDDREQADVFDFVDAYLADRERGTERGLGEYLARFPRSQSAVAREWLAMQAASQATTGGMHSAADVHGHTDELRIGPYRILRELGRGGQGSVHLAEDTRIARTVALKILSSRFDAISAEKLKRFRREAEVIAKLEHPGLCVIYEADIDGETPYIAMRYIEGRSLADGLVEARAQGSWVHGELCIPPRRALEVHVVLFMFERAARALHAAHEAGVIHRDVKPGNIAIAPDGKPVLLDFGLARDEQSDVPSLTESGALFGTPAYMSPEQLALRSDELDRRTDVYSLGVALFEALTLRRPFEAPASTALYVAIQNDPTPDARRFNSVLSEEVKVVLETALEKDRARRYASALELAEDLRRIREFEPIRARPASIGLRFRRWAYRHPAIAVATSGTIVALSIGIAVLMHLLARERDALARERVMLSYAVGRHLAQRSATVLHEDPSLALALGIEAVERAPNYLTRSELFAALERCRLERVLDGPGGTTQTTDLALAKDGSRFALAFSDGTLGLWGRERGAKAAWVEIAPGVSSLIEFTPDGRALASGGSDGFVRLWDAASQTSVSTRDLGGPISCVASAPDGASLAAVVQGRAVHVLALPGLETRHVLAVDGLEPTQALFDGASERVLVSGACAALFDVRSAERMHTFAYASPLSACAWNADAGLLALGRMDGVIEITDEQGQSKLSAPLELAAKPSAMAFSADGRWLAVGTKTGEAGLLCRVDLASGAVLRIDAHEGRAITQVAFSPDGKRLASASFDATLRLFDARDCKELLRLPVGRRPLDLAWSADGQLLVSRATGSAGHVWFAHPQDDMFDLVGHTQAVQSVEFSRDGRLALSASDDGSARLWNTARAAESAPRYVPGELVFAWQLPCAVTRARFDAAGERVLCTGADGSVHVFDSCRGEALRAPIEHGCPLQDALFDARGERIATLSSHGGARMFRTRDESAPIELLATGSGATCIAFAPDGARLAVGTADDRVLSFDVQSGALLGTARVHDSGRAEGPGGIVGLKFHPRGAELALACSDRVLRFLRAEDGSAARDSQTALDFRSMCYSGDGKHILAAGRFGGGAVRVIDVESRTVQFNDSRHADHVTSASFNADASLVLTTSLDGTAFVWSTSNGTPVAQRKGFAAAVLCGALDLSGQGERAITGCADGRVCVWPVDPLPAAKARQPRQMNHLEKERESEMALPLRYD